MSRVLIFAVALAVASAAPQPNPTNIFEIDITPEEAQKYLNSPPFTEPQLSGRTNVLPLIRWNDPRFRSAEAGPTLGHYWKNGHEIENTDDYVEEVYDASQFHGQDGLGAYAYGYQAPESSKVENRARSGDVTGSYTYKDGNNELIKVRYWADSEGFHQEDNLPKIELKPQEETEEVRQARLAHEKAWQEAAAAAAQQPDPQGEYNPEKNDYQPSASETQGVSVSAPGQGPREGKAFSQFGASANAQFGQQRPQFGQQTQYSQQGSQYSQQKQQYSQQGQKQQYSQQSQQYGQQSQQTSPQKYGQYGGQQGQGTTEEPEPTGPPRGFFYSFNYPVSIIVAKNAGETGPANPGQPIDNDTVGVYSKQQRG